MIEPLRQGAGLRAEVEATCPGPGVLAVWWLGQSGFLIKSRGGTLLIDPYLSEHLTDKYTGTDRPHIRMTRAPLRGGELSGIDLVAASHKHSDHLDPGTMPDVLAASPGARLVLPGSLVEHARAMRVPADRLIEMVAGQTIHEHGFRLRAVPSAHEGLDTDAEGRHLYLGYVIESEGLRLYHSGDSLAYDGLATWLGPDPFDVLFLPINGRDPARGVPGNMSAAEAVTLAALVRPRFLVPHHYDMFTFNTVPVAQFEAEARNLPGGGELPGPPLRRALGDHTVSVTLGIDVGTSGTKTIAIDEGGTILASASAEYPCDHPRPGWSEQEPELWWRATAATVRQILDGGRVRPGDIAGIGLSGQMHGSVFLDADGRVIRPALLWNDQRTAAECAEIEDCAGGSRSPDPAGRKPRPDWLHGAEDLVDPQERAEALGAGPPGPLAQGLHPIPPDRHLRHRGQRRVGDAPARRREPPMESRSARQARPRPIAFARLPRKPRGLGAGGRPGRQGDRSGRRQPRCRRGRRPACRRGG